MQRTNLTQKMATNAYYCVQTNRVTVFIQLQVNISWRLCTNISMSFNTATTHLAMQEKPRKVITANHYNRNF